MEFNAHVLLGQLGGIGRLAAMTGAKNFIHDDANKRLAFRLPSGFAKGGINTVRITLANNDTYTMEFLSIRGARVVPKETRELVHADQLRGVFTNVTGLDLHL